MPLAFFTALRYWKVGLGVMLLLALAVQTVRLDRAHSTIKVRDAQINLRDAAIARLQDESRQRTERGKQAVEASKHVVERIREQREIIRNTPPSPDCKTPASVMEAEL